MPISTKENPPYVPVDPETPEVLLGELHDGVEPVPEGEAAVRERLLAELRPTHHRSRKVVRVAVAPEGLARQEPGKKMG